MDTALQPAAEVPTSASELDSALGVAPGPVEPDASTPQTIGSQHRVPLSNVRKSLPSDEELNQEANTPLQQIQEEHLQGGPQQAQNKFKWLEKIDYPKMPLQRKIEVRHEMKQQVMDYIADGNRATGQDSDPTVLDMQASGVIGARFPLSEQERQIETTYLKQTKEISASQEKSLLATRYGLPEAIALKQEDLLNPDEQKQLDAARARMKAPENWVEGKLADLSHGVVTGIPSIIGSTAKLGEAGGSQIIHLYNKITGNKVQVPYEMGQTGPVRFAEWWKSHVEDAVPPSKGMEHGDLSSQIANTLGQLGVLSGIGKFTKAAVGEKSAETMSKLMMMGFQSDMSGEQIFQDAFKKNLADGMDPVKAQADARDKADLARLITAPLGYKMAKFSPFAKMEGLSKDVIPLTERMLVGGIGQAMGFGVQSGATQALEYIPHVFNVKDFEYNNIMESFRQVGTDSLVGMVSGGLISAFSPGMSPAAKQAMEVFYQKDLDVTGARELKRVFVQEMRLSGDVSRAAFKVFDAAAEIASNYADAPDPHATKTAFYLATIANRLQRNLPGMVKMMQEVKDGVATGNSAGLYSELRKKVLDPKFAQSFGKGGDAGEVLRYLENQPGIKADELHWTETADFLREMKEQGKKAGVKELLEHLDENEVRVVTTMKGADIAAKLTTSYKEIAARIDENQKETQKAYDTPAPIKQRNQQLGELNLEREKLFSELDTASTAAHQAKPSYQSITPSGPSTGYEEWLLKLPVNENKPIGESYSPPHFGPEARNTIVHVRLDERQVGGVRTMMVHEVQPDLSEEVRKAEKAGLTREQANLPEFPFSKGTQATELAWKKILLEAVDRGYEQIAWAPGELQDKFQGFPGEKAAAGRRENYNKITPQIVMKLLKGRGFGGEVEVGEIETTQSQALSRLPIHEHNGAWYIGNEGPFATQLEAQNHQEAFAVNAARGGKDPVFLLKLPPEVRQRIASEGFPLFQGEIKPTKLHEFLQPKEQLKALLMRDGTVIVGRGYDEHAQLIRQNQIDPREIKSAGVVVKAGDEVRFHGSNAFLPFYVADVHGGPAMTPITPEDTSLTVGPEKGRTVEDYKKQSLMSKLREGSFFQGSRASVEFLDTMQAVMRGLNNPDASSAVHEPAHVLAMHFMPEQYLKQLENWLGVKDEVWGTPNHEKFAEAMESYIASNRPPSGDLEGAFEMLSEQIKTVYKAVDNSPLGMNIPEQTRQFFDSMFSKPRENIEEARKPVLQIDKQIQRLQTELSAFDTSKYEGMMDEAQAKKEIATLEGQKQELVDKLQREQKLALNWRAETRQERLYKEAQAVPIPPREAPENFWSVARDASRVMHSIGRLLTNASLINDTETGKRLTYVGDDLHAKINRFEGRFQKALEDVFNALTRKDRASFVTHEDGQWKLRQIYDQVGATKPREAVTPADKMAVGLVARVMAELDQNAEAINTYRTLNSGDKLPFIQSFQRRMPVLLNDTGFSAIREGKGHVVFDALVDWVVSRPKNIEAGITRETFSRDLKANQEAILNRPLGMYEFVKNVPEFPDVLRVGGIDLPITHGQLFDFLPRIINRAAVKQAVVGKFGQMMLDNVAEGSEKYVSRLTRLSRIFSTPIVKDAEALKNDLIEHVPDVAPELEGMTQKQLLQAVHDIGVSTRVNGNDLLSTLLDKTTDDIPNDTARRKLRSLATEIGGVDSRGPIGDVWNEMKRRLSTQIEDDVIKYWKEAHTNEGGSGTKFDKWFRILQGIPERNLDLSNPLVRGLVAMTSIADTAITIRTVFKHLGRPARAASRGGLVNAAEKFVDTIDKYPSRRDEALLAGSFRRTDWELAPETNSWLLRVSHEVNWVSRTMNSAVNSFSLTYVSNVARGLMQHWGSGGFGKTDVATAYSLRATPEDVKLLLDTNGKGLTEEMGAKFIQNFGNIVEGMTESPTRRGVIETDPLFKKIFSLNNFLLMAARDSVNVAKGVWEAVKSRDNLQQLGAAKLLARYLAAMMGSGLVTQIIYGKVRGKPSKPDDENPYKMLARALFQSHAFIVSEHIMDPGGLDQNLFSHMISAVPGITAWASALQTLVGTEGRTQDLPVKERAKAAAQQAFPFVETFTNWWEKENNLPRFQSQEIKNRVVAFRRTMPGYKEGPSVVAPLNPDYWPVYEATSRLDLGDALARAQEYLDQQVKRGVMPKDAARGLRQSLEERRPINLSRKQIPMFLSTLDEETRARATILQQEYMGIVNRVVPLPQR